jgi:hypothetical protein
MHMSIFKDLFGKENKGDSSNPEVIRDASYNKTLGEEIEAVKSGTINKIYPILKPGDWVGIQAGALRQTLIGTPEDPKLVIAYGYDAPNNFIFINYSDINESNTVDNILAQAYKNLDEYEVPLNEVMPGKVIIVDGKDFCSEKILDTPFMLSMHKKLGSPELWVSIPRRRCMMITSAFNDEGVMQQFMSVHNKTWSDASYGNAPIINSLFQIKEGNIVGIIEV